MGDGLLSISENKNVKNRKGRYMFDIIQFEMFLCSKWLPGWAPAHTGSRQ